LPIDFSFLEGLMTVFIILAGVILLFLLYRAHQDSEKNYLPHGVILLSVVVILEKLVFSDLDFFDWIIVVVFGAGALIGIRKIIVSERKEG